MSIFDEFEYEAPDPASHDPRNKAFDILKREDIKSNFVKQKIYK